MDKEKIIQIQKEVESLYKNPSQGKDSFSYSLVEEILSGFWDYHVRKVIELSVQMAPKYQADMEVVWLGAILHSIDRLDGAELHDQIGADRGYQLLIEHGYTKETAQKVKKIILSHRCRDVQPATLEEKIVATADAMSHFLTPFYIWVARYSESDFSSIAEKNARQIEKDFSEKIFFDQERELVRKEYEVLKKWFEKK